MTVEYLATPVQPRRRPTRTGQALVLLALVLVALGALGLVRWTQATRDHANATLARVLAEAEDRATIGEASVLATLAYASPMIWSTSVPESVQAGLRGVVEARAGQIAADLAELEAEAAGVGLLTWQGQQGLAREQVLAAVRAQRERFDRIAADARSIGQVMAEARPSSDAARAALRASGGDEALTR